MWRALRNINDKDHAAWQHIVGREGEAMAVLAALASAPKVLQDWLGSVGPWCPHLGQHA